MLVPRGSSARKPLLPPLWLRVCVRPRGLIGSCSAHTGSAEPGAAAAAWPCERNTVKAQRVLLVQSRVLKSCVDTAPALPPRVKVTMMLKFFRLLYHLKNKL